MKTHYTLFLLTLLLLCKEVFAQSWYPLDHGLNGRVYDMKIYGDDLYIFGEFINAGGNPDADRIARWDGCDWHAVAPGVNGPVYDVAILDDRIYIAGLFGNLGGNPATGGVAYWDGSAWHGLGSGLDNNAYALKVFGGNLYVGGGFSHAGGVPNTQMIARWDGSNWHSVGSEGTAMTYSDHYIDRIEVFGNDLYVFGEFFNLDGVSEADILAIWNGTTWRGFDGPNGAVFAFGNSDIFLSGPHVTDVGGNPDADYIARWDGSAWTGISPDTVFNGTYGWVVDQDFLYCRRQNSIDRYNITTGVWESVIPIIPHEFTSLAAINSQIYIGGYFDSPFDTLFSNIARWGEPIDCGFTHLPDNLFDFSDIFYAYPNPAYNLIYYGFDSETLQAHSLTLTDARGKTLLQKESEVSHLNIEQFPAGVYFLHVQSQGKMGITKVLRR